MFLKDKNGRRGSWKLLYHKGSCESLKISVITVVLNGRRCIEDCIQSVLSQTYNDIEYIVVDGGSMDGTREIIRKHEDEISRWTSGSDKGMYDAMNKGIELATGDVVGFLHSDDVYSDNNVLDKVAREFEKQGVDSVFADLVYIAQRNPDKIVRYYRAHNFTPRMFAYGWMPPHPTFFVKRNCYERFGLFKTDYAIAADYELLARFIGKHNITYQYLPEVIVKMKTGGRSTKNLRSNLILNKEIIRACAENGIKTSYLKVYSKYLTKISQLFRRP
jgi:glycosyltransferase involved in cell wall biosynthesis